MANAEIRAQLEDIKRRFLAGAGQRSELLAAIDSVADCQIDLANMNSVVLREDVD